MNTNEIRKKFASVGAILCGVGVFALEAGYICLKGNPDALVRAPIDEGLLGIVAVSVGMAVSSLVAARVGAGIGAAISYPIKLCVARQRRNALVP